MQKTDHSEQIAYLRERSGVIDKAAASLLEIHDATGLNLHEAPDLLRFVEWLIDGPVTNNHV